ncbi:hypothetical protein ACWC24_32525 [Streptomyces sp. NPDC001443]
MKKAIVAGAFALVSAATCLVVAPSASATANSCVTTKILTGGPESVGTTVRKSSTSTCSDLNLTYSDDASANGYDGYAGRLYHSSSDSYVTCDAGYVWAKDGSHSASDKTYWLCTDVADNALFTVASATHGGDTVHITH